MPKFKKKVLVGWISDEFSWEMIEQYAIPTLLPNEDRGMKFRTKIRLTLEEIK